METKKEAYYEASAKLTFWGKAEFFGTEEFVKTASKIHSTYLVIQWTASALMFGYVLLDWFLK
jgi:hypothetical protein